MSDLLEDGCGCPSRAYGGPHLDGCGWGADAWNRWGEGLDGARPSWTAPLCFRCWMGREGARAPVRVMPPDAEVCCLCGEGTRSGIFIRLDPAVQVFKAWEVVA